MPLERHQWTTGCETRAAPTAWPALSPSHSLRDGITAGTVENSSVLSWSSYLVSFFMIITVVGQIFLIRFLLVEITSIVRYGAGIHEGNG